jgi:hypothetical protein
MQHHFFPSGVMGEAVNFTNMWLPHDCAVHRFTNESIKRSVDYLIENEKDYKGLTAQRVKLSFVGDSVTRGNIHIKFVKRF